jgi:hypothetical protein
MASVVTSATVNCNRSSSSGMVMDFIDRFLRQNQRADGRAQALTICSGWRLGARMSSSRGLAVVGDDVGARSRSVLTQVEKHIENGRDLLPHVPVSCRPLLAELFNLQDVLRRSLIRQRIAAKRQNNSGLNI